MKKIINIIKCPFWMCSLGHIHGFWKKNTCSIPSNTIGLGFFEALNILLTNQYIRA